ncbi:MAG: flippase-like domain-containing protein [Oligoflexales bacterium]|nr:flippase-like domain-containing protein [Oligoflexales bacterium]
MNLKSAKKISDRLRSILVTSLKLLLAAFLIGWLIRSGKLDFSQLGILIKYPSILISMIFFWFLCGVLIGSARWRLLLTSAGIRLSYRRAANLQMTGLFFNTAMPGSVSGDLIKAYYVIRDNHGHAKSGAFLSIVLDRLLGLAGLLSISIFVILIDFSRIIENPALMSIVGTLLLFGIFLAFFFGAALYHYRGKDPFLPFLNLRIPGMGIIRNLYESLREYRNHRKNILICLVMSIFNQIAYLGLFCIITISLLPQGLSSITKIAAVFPLGMLITSIPIAPGGLGVGHVAFENLFNLVGLSEGANVYNVFTLIGLALNLIGFVPYLYLTRGGSRESILRTQDDTPPNEGCGDISQRNGQTSECCEKFT